MSAACGLEAAVDLFILAKKHDVDVAVLRKKMSCCVSQAHGWRHRSSVETCYVCLLLFFTWAFSQNRLELRGIPHNGCFNPPLTQRRVLNEWNFNFDFAIPLSCFYCGRLGGEGRGGCCYLFFVWPLGATEVPEHFPSLSPRSRLHIACGVTPQPLLSVSVCAELYQTETES